MAEDKRSRRLVWSTDPRKMIPILLEQCDGDRQAAIQKLVQPPCSWTAARQMADAFADLFGVTPAEFMKLAGQKRLG